MPEKNTALQKKLENLPDKSGVYIFKNNKNKIIYIGKAKVLKNRVKSYFNQTEDNRIFYKKLISNIENIDWLITNSEKEALILENSLIKQFKPKYNIDLKDDSNFYSVKIDTTKEFPRLELVRVQKNDSSHYFGPYSSAASVKQTVGFLNKLFQLRTCSDYELSSRTRPCILYQIGKCSAPCVQKIKPKDYNEQIKRTIQILKGKTKILISELEEEMHKFSDDMKYEKAGEIRDRIRALRKTVENQIIVDSSFIDKDVFAYVIKNNDIYIQGLFIRDGIIRTYFHQTYPTFNRSEADVFLSFLNLFYSTAKFLPKEIIIPLENEGTQLLNEVLNIDSPNKLKIISPIKGQKKKLLDLCFENAKQNADTKQAKELEYDIAMEKIKDAFSLKNIPLNMECYDISNIQGQDNVASGVAFQKGRPNKKMYRKYKIKTVDQADDFASLNEVINRRIKKGITEDNLPDLFVIDGGKAQLSSSYQALLDHQIIDVDIVSIAKARNEKGTVDRFFIIGNNEPIFLKENSLELKILMNIRDESHRFAITFHRKLRGKKFKEDPLHGISGIGPIKRRALLKHFGNIGAIRQANLSELMGVNGINENQAKLIIESLKL
ncbi:MAG: excinuclease ABC subunit C [Planctomycetota bacterium]|nr:MAG: excinuclease ABC subunit C [Planctomycetota bacterium]